MVKILLCEDDVSLNNSLVKYFYDAGYEVTGCLNAAAALRALDERAYDLIITDVMMPGMDGFEFSEAVRAADKSTPIIFITARDDMPSKERGYRIGIDDYLVKPFDPAELIMRISAVLRRVGIEQSKRIKVGDFVMNEEEHSAYLKGEELALTVREFDVLFKLLSFPKKTFSRSRLMEEFWGYDSSTTSRAVDVCVVELRKKTAACDGFEIVTVHGLGYKAVIK